MLPPMLSTRPGPKPMPLATLALLIAAATIMLACGPAAQPIPVDGDGLPAAVPATPTPEPNIGTDDLDTGEGTQNFGSGWPLDMPPPPPIPTLKYPNLEHTLDELAIAADNAGGGGQSEVAADDFVEVSIWMDTNPDDDATKALVEWLKARGISSSVYGRLAGYGDGSFISARVPAHLLGAISLQEGVGRVKDDRGNVPLPRPVPIR